MGKTRPRVQSNFELVSRVTSFQQLFTQYLVSDKVISNVVNVIVIYSHTYLAVIKVCSVFLCFISIDKSLQLGNGHFLAISFKSPFVFYHWGSSSSLYPFKLLLRFCFSLRQLHRLIATSGAEPFYNFKASENISSQKIVFSRY